MPVARHVATLCRLHRASRFMGSESLEILMPTTEIVLSGSTCRELPRRVEAQNRHQTLFLAFFSVRQAPAERPAEANWLFTRRMSAVKEDMALSQGERSRAQRAVGAVVPLCYATESRRCCVGGNLGKRGGSLSLTGKKRGRRQVTAGLPRNMTGPQSEDGPIGDWLQARGGDLAVLRQQCRRTSLLHPSG